jgi:endoglucanase
VRFRARRWLLLAVLVLVLTSAGDAGQQTSASAVTSSALFVDAQSSVARWVAEHPDDPRAAALRKRLVANPVARWYTDHDPVAVGIAVRQHVAAADAEGTVPVLVLYALPDRDCGGASAGGAPDWQAYTAWVRAAAQGLGTSDAIVILEPDSLSLQGCVSQPRDQAERHRALSAAVDILKRHDAAARVYLDGGHSSWHPVSIQAQRLQEAGVMRADGFATNVSNFRSTSAETAYGARLRAALGGSPEQVIDTSRNGAGPLDDQWCDPPGRRAGVRPTLETGRDHLAAYLWLKSPGEADGCAAPAGTFVPDLAADLAAAP